MSRILELLFPPKCLLCRRVLGSGAQDLCRDCRVHEPSWKDGGSKIPFVKSKTALWHYEGQVRKSLLRYKFYGKRSYAVGYGRLLAMKLLEEGPFDVLTWVPISRRRKSRRGYDQCELLAEAVGKGLGMAPVRCLRRIRHDPPQSGIRDYAQRRANVLGAYEAVAPERFAGKRVLLLDDVITTGATVSECARVLLTAGAAEVHCAAVAGASKKKVKNTTSR